MRLTPYQVFLSVVAVGIIVERTIRFFKREQNQSVLKYISVIAIWGSIGAVSLFPQIAHYIRITFGFGDNFNTIIFIAFVILFVLYFRLLSIVERIESNITEIIRREALAKRFSKRKSVK